MIRLTIRFLQTLRLLPIYGSIAAALAFCPKASAQSMEYVVFSINGEGAEMELGQTLFEGEKIEIAEHVEIQLISKSGEIISLKGPIVATVTNEGENIQGEDALSKITKLLFADQKFTQTLGGTRSTDNHTDIRQVFPPTPVSNPWRPELGSAKVYCLKKNFELTRISGLGKKLKVKFNDDHGEVFNATWKPGSGSISYADLIDAIKLDPLQNAPGDKHDVSLHFAPSELGSLAQEVAWMVERGCNSQAIQLLSNSIK